MINGPKPMSSMSRRVQMQNMPPSNDEMFFRPMSAEETVGISQWHAVILPSRCLGWWSSVEFLDAWTYVSGPCLTGVQVYISRKGSSLSSIDTTRHVLSCSLAINHVH